MKKRKLTPGQPLRIFILVAAVLITISGLDLLMTWISKGPLTHVLIPGVIALMYTIVLLISIIALRRQKGRLEGREPERAS